MFVANATPKTVNGIASATVAITVLVPAHDEELQIGETLQSLWQQTTRPTRIVVIADNCSDDTVDIATSMGVEVFVTNGNRHKKAGALNQWLDRNLKMVPGDELLMVMDADSTLDRGFLTNAVNHIAKGYSACGGVFQGKDGGGFVGMLQRNEYARYARDVARKDGKTLVLTGTATVFTAQCLKDVVSGRQSGQLPSSGKPSVYDTTVLTEDNELTFALLTLGHTIIAPAKCALTTEVMSSWTDLWKQRLRWKRGAIENNVQYGFTRVTAKYWLLQIWGFLGLLATATYLLTLAVGIFLGTLHFLWVWMIVTGIYVAERAVTVRSRGSKQMLLASVLLVEMPFDLFLQAVHAKAFFDAFRRAKSVW